MAGIIMELGGNDLAGAWLYIIGSALFCIPSVLGTVIEVNRLK